MGYRTVIMSTDSAHSLADSLDFPLTGEIKNVEKNLDAIEVDVLFEMEHNWKEIGKYVSDFLEAQGMDAVSAKEMTVWPGMELMSALFYLEEFYKNDSYDVVVLDTAPTGDTLRLLSFPETSDWYFDKLYKVFRNTVRIARMTVGKFMNTPLPSNEFLNDLDMIRNRMTSVKKILTDPNITSIRLVVNPERMVINETKRAFTYLCLYNLTVECLVINRLISEDDKDSYPVEKWAEQEKYMEMIEESFSPLDMLRSNMFKTEVVGRDKLNLLAQNVFGDTDPTRIFSTEKAMEIYRKDGMDILSLKLPFSTKDEVELYKAGDVLIVKVGWYKRSVSLPYSFVKKDATKAEFKEGRLLIKFEEVKKDAKKESSAC